MTATVNAGASIDLIGGLTGPTANLSINGFGPNNAGALRSLSGANVLSGTLNLNGNVTPGNTLTKFGPGDLTIGGTGGNTYTGGTT
ncbi:MAG: hypothetical protein K2P78_02940 [Gemmataceae bacterium]|nr:hypothetical protein [Gemmataceae bacterium]